MGHKTDKMGSLSSSIGEASLDSNACAESDSQRSSTEENSGRISCDKDLGRKTLEAIARDLRRIGDEVNRSGGQFLGRRSNSRRVAPARKRGPSPGLRKAKQ